MNKRKIFLATFIFVMLIGSCRIYVLAKNNTTTIEQELLNESKGLLGTIISLDRPSNDLKEEMDSTSEENEVQETIISKHVETAIDGEISISFAGDVLFDPSYSVYSSYLSRGQDVKSCFSEEVLNEMRNADIMMLNNEFPYSDRGEPLPDKTYTFRAPTDSVSLLNKLGVDLVSIANNHMFDYGEEAFKDTIDTLRDDDLAYVGGGYNIEEASKPYVIEANGKTVAFFAATQIERTSNPDTKGATENTPGVFRCFEPEKLIEEIKKADELYDFVILYVHWGNESTDVLDWAQPDQAKEYVKAGADAIIGDHPHVLQGITYMEDVPIIYSLGNFWFNSKPLDTCIVTLKLDCNENIIKEFKFKPCKQMDMKVTMLEGSEKQRVLGYMRSISSGVNIDDEGIVTSR